MDRIVALAQEAPDSKTPVDGAAGDGRFIDGYLAYLLAQASSRVSREFHREVTAAGLSVTEWRVLASLAGSDGETISALSQLALTKQPTLSKVVQRMEADGLVERTGVRSDRRQTVVRTTLKGRRLASMLCERALRHQQAVLGPFGADNARRLLAMLRELLALHPPSPPDDA